MFADGRLADDYNSADPQHECEFCGRSVITRFGGAPNYECDSCAAEFDLLNRAGKLEVNENLEDYGVRQALRAHGLLPHED